jgi:hypothetical protein
LARKKRSSVFFLADDTPASTVATSSWRISTPRTSQTISEPVQASSRPSHLRCVPIRATSFHHSPMHPGRLRHRVASVELPLRYKTTSRTARKP